MMTGGQRLGFGVYSATEAARLVGLHPDRVRRWVQGYEYLYAGERKRATPVVIREDRRDLTFADLVEVLFVRAFLEHGVTMPVIRKASTAAKELFGVSRPFSLKRFETDGRSIFARIGSDSHEDVVLDLAKRQHVFARVIQPYMKQLDYENDVAARWWPLGKQEPIVVDPKRAFGAPITAHEGIPTHVLYNAVQAGQSEQQVANWFEVSLDAVQAAVRFEANKGSKRLAA